MKCGRGVNELLAGLVCTEMKWMVQTMIQLPDILSGQCAAMSDGRKEFPTGRERERAREKENCRSSRFPLNKQLHIRYLQHNCVELTHLLTYLLADNFKQRFRALVERILGNQEILEKYQTSRVSGRMMV